MSKSASPLGAALLSAMAAIATANIATAADSAPPPALTPAEAVAGHCAAWNTTVPAERDRLLRRVLAQDSVYNDPAPTYATGPAALSAVIADFQRHNPGARFRCSAPQVHHGAMRVSWLLVGPDGKVITPGMDFYELSKDGRIHRITGFFGPPPAVETER
jgi:hypothetical protein